MEKTPSPPEPEPVGAAQKNKETSSSKDKKSVDKKSATENNKQKNGKQEVREPAPCVQPPTVEANAMQTGDKTPKKSEKRRQSLGGFLKGLVSRWGVRGFFLGSWLRGVIFNSKVGAHRKPGEQMTLMHLLGTRHCSRHREQQTHRLFWSSRLEAGRMKMPGVGDSMI